MLLAEILSTDLFDAALPRLGVPALDEMYGFVPALALGGSREAGNLHRLKAAVQLSIPLQC